MTVSDVLHRSDAFAFTGGARGGAGYSGESSGRSFLLPWKRGGESSGWGSGESAGAGDPCLRSDKGRQRSVPLGSGSSSVVLGAMREGSASAARSESGETCR